MVQTVAPPVLDICLPPCVGAEKAEGRGLSGYPCNVVIQNAGRALHVLVNKDDVAANASNKADEKDDSANKGTDFAAQASMTDKEDLYQMLGLGDLRWRATQQDIRKAYRQCVLKYHPDKMSQNAGADEEGGEEKEEAKGEAEDVSDIPKPVRAVIEKLLEAGKTDAAILANYQMEEFIQGNDVCPKGLENPEEKVARLRRVKEGKSGKETEADQDFKALSNAMSILSDVQKRKAFDSKDAGAMIDDSLPADKKPKSDADFFKVWAPVFDRNARWSSAGSMPKLGDMQTPIEEVLEIYDAWFNMESWRDFSMEHDDSYDLEDATCREERRWMERQNKKLAEKSKKDEKNRINTMIETAHKWDPRIIAYKEELKNKKWAAKQARFADARKAQEEEAKRKQEEEEARKRAEEEEAIKRKAEKALRKARKALRDNGEALGLDAEAAAQLTAVCDAVTVTGELGISVDMVSELAEQLAALSTDDKNALKRGRGQGEAAKKLAEAAEKITGKPDEGGDSTPVAAAAPAEMPSVVASVPKKEKDRKWSRDEMDQLHKALLKYPAGTQQRWEKIAGHVGSRSDAECQRKCGELKNNFAASAAGMASDEKLEFERARKEAAKGHGSRSGAGKKTSGTSVTADREIGREGYTASELKEMEDKEMQKKEGETGEEDKKPDKEAKKEEKKAGTEEWSTDQQRALEAAMLEFKASTLEAKDKWKAIAELVPGKSDKECIRRVKEIKAMLAAKGGG